jgi:plasmid maintenance system antidote protein VapI
MTPLERIIKERGIKKSWLAQKAGISNSAMTRLCQGGKPTVDVAIRISKALGVTLEDLWGHMIYSK